MAICGILNLHSYCGLKLGEVDTLAKICSVLNCQPGDILEFVGGENNEEHE